MKKDVERHTLTFDKEWLRRTVNDGYIWKSSDGKRILNIQHSIQSLIDYKIASEKRIWEMVKNAGQK